jgi:hypothetical protein
MAPSRHHPRSRLREFLGGLDNSDNAEHDSSCGESFSCYRLKHSAVVIDRLELTTAPIGDGLPRATYETVHALLGGVILPGVTRVAGVQIWASSRAFFCHAGCKVRRRL